ncbi:MAG: YCF48-related protein, partial [Chloroflexota bacterium]
MKNTSHRKLNRHFARYRQNMFITILGFLIFFAGFSNVQAHSPHDVVNTFTISPQYAVDKTVFVYVDRLLRSTDGGYSWKELIQGLDFFTVVADIEVSPAFQTDQTVFIAVIGHGIYKSTNKGDSWSKVNRGLHNLDIYRIRILKNKKGEQIILAASTKGGLYKSRNGGDDWYKVLGDQTRITSFMKVHGYMQGEIFIGSRTGDIYKSSDEGESWQVSFSIPDAGKITSIAISPDFLKDQTFFVGTAKKGLLKTTDGGQSYFSHNAGLGQFNYWSLGYQTPHITDIVLSPMYHEDEAIFVSSWYQAVFRSENGGDSWHLYNRGLKTFPQADNLGTHHFDFLEISQNF